MKGYLATFFFDNFGFEGTERLAQYLEKNTDIEWYVPQRNGEINDKKNNDGNITDKAIYRGDSDRLLESDILVACIDGVEIDSGVSCEVGLLAGYLEAFVKMGTITKPKLILGLYTDMRQDGTGDNHMYKNLYTKGAINYWGKVVRTKEEILGEINAYIKYMNKYYKE
jgi:hypothetical protein